jgi:hypothetical protein
VDEERVLNSTLRGVTGASAKPPLNDNHLHLHEHRKQSPFGCGAM